MINEGVALLSLAIGATAAAGGLVGFYKERRGRSINEYLEQDNRAVKAYNETLERERVSLTTELQAVRESREALRKQNHDLVGLAQGAPQLKDLTEQIKELVEAVKKISERNM